MTTSKKQKTRDGGQANHSSVPLSIHAVIRCQQRSFSQLEIAYVLEHARMLRRSGICFYFLAAKDVPFSDRRISWVQRLVGATLLLGSEGEVVITVYKNENGLKDIKRKVKFRLCR